MAQDTAVIDRLLDAAVLHVAFDGWSDTTFRAAVTDTGVDPTVARALLPRGAVDLAVAFHKRGDDAMARALAAMDLDQMRYRDRVAQAVRTRLEVVADKEAVRRGSTLFALPMHAPDGARLIWGTADRIWTVLGDTSQDFNWYTKRATLSGVYSSTVLYWLGDDSLNHQATWDFLERRIDNVMQIEKFKGTVRNAPGFGKLAQGLEAALSRIQRPSDRARGELPGQFTLPR